MGKLLIVLLNERYLVWIKKDKTLVANLRDYFNQAEEKLRAHPDFSAVFDEDLITLQEFRKAAGIGSFKSGIEEDPNDQESRMESETVGSRLSHRRRRSFSANSSVSTMRSKASVQSNLSPVHAQEASSDEDEDKQGAVSHTLGPSGVESNSSDDSTDSPVDEESEDSMSD
jgi:hypothetical protein